VSTLAAPPEPLLTFWFGSLQEGFADHDHRQAWFTGGRAMDERVRERFADLPEAAAAGTLDAWLDSPRGRLAWIIACDQLPRHLYRGTAQAFAYDRRALAAARVGIEAGVDRELGFDERAFFYLPFEHSESTVDQHTAVGLFTALRDSAPAERRELAGSWLPHAIQHRDLILRFGRFPHRNAVLGRASSAAEHEYLATGSTFGQG
jgi:uncharacterized protein (DUF924 family)